MSAQPAPSFTPLCLDERAAQARSGFLSPATTMDAIDAGAGEMPRPDALGGAWAGVMLSLARQEAGARQEGVSPEDQGRRWERALAPLGASVARGSFAMPEIARLGALAWLRSACALSDELLGSPPGSAGSALADAVSLASTHLGLGIVGVFSAHAACQELRGIDSLDAFAKPTSEERLGARPELAPAMPPGMARALLESFELSAQSAKPDALALIQPSPRL